MSLRIRIVLIIILPLLLMTAAVVWVIQTQSQDFLQEQSTLLRESLRSTKKSALRDYVELAETALKPILENKDLNESQALAETSRILSTMTFGEHGYFFLYDAQGKNLVHPLKPSLQDKNLWSWRDSKGKYVIQDLLKTSANPNAEQRFEDYHWEKIPNNKQEAPKLGYVTRLKPWNWMLGTGLYMDDVELEARALENQVTANVRKNVRIILFALSLTTFIIFLLMLSVNMHESRLANRRLRKVAHNFVNLQVQERRRFARELHDGINQFLVATKYRIELGLKQADQATGQHRKPLEQSLELLDQSILEIKSISHALRPVLLDDLGLEKALDSLLQQFQERTKIRVRRTYQLKQKLADEIETTIYRVIQEGLTNIERHANASEVELRLSEQAEQLELLLQDNGIGFSINKHPKGMGLINMRERIELLGGIFHLHSKVNHGTRYTAQLPLTPSEF